MKITKLKIENFKAIKNIKLDGLSNTVLIAGPNGCGKSCVFHGIRLLKSFIGGHQPNEWHQWFNEFHINLQNIGKDIIQLFQTDDRKLQISAEFELHNTEKIFLENEGQKMLEYNLLKMQHPSLINSSIPLSGQSYKARPIGHQYNNLLTQISKQCEPQFKNLQRELSQPLRANFEAYSTGQLSLNSSTALQLAFSFYEESLGIIDYHGPHRDYQRERLGNINLNIQTSRQSMKQHSLYNYAHKYKNVKQEMVGAYIRNLLIKESGGVTGGDKDSDLIKTLKELFKEFFPEKEFLGPKPNEGGGIDFPVKLANGTEHDIDDLSSGEKEVLYGYLRLRYSAPKHSIILLDEPELHLNPRLISGLPHFYKKHLGDKLGNQILLITHSDTFLREAMREKDYQVYHMKTPFNISPNTKNQITIVDANSALDKAMIDLVGDLATYSPDKKMVLLEGEESEFDLKMIKKLFPEFQENVNLISVGSKNQVKNLHNLLVEANKKEQLNTKVFSIVDKDLDDELPDRPGGKFHWNAYHIENYLLDEDYLTESINGLILENPPLNEEKILDFLIKCAKESVNNLIKVILEKTVYKETFKKISLGFDPNNKNISRETFDALKRSIDNISNIPNEEYLKKLKETEKQIREEFTQAFKDNSWKSKVRGRDVLTRLVSELNTTFSGEKLSYKNLRNNVISIMAKREHKPEGMKKVIEEINNA